MARRRRRPAGNGVGFTSATLSYTLPSSKGTVADAVVVAVCVVTAHRAERTQRPQRPAFDRSRQISTLELFHPLCSFEDRES